MSPRDAPESPRSSHRIAAPRGYLPLAADEGHSTISTRGQNLPGLLQQTRSSTNLSSYRVLSSTNLAGLRNRPQDRRRSSLGPDDLPRSSNVEEDHDLRRIPSSAVWSAVEHDEHDRRMSLAANILLTPQMRSQRLIGNSNPRYRWERYWKTDEELKKMNKPIRQYYERNNYLIQHYMYIDRLLDSSLPHNLLQEYQAVDSAPTKSPFDPADDVPATISEEPTPLDSPVINGKAQGGSSDNLANGSAAKVKRTPKDIYRVKDDENSPLLRKTAQNGDEEEQLLPPDLELEEETGSQSRIVSIAIYVNLVANTLLLAMKIVVVALSSSVSVLASLVDAALDFLSTAIVWVTTRLIAHKDQYAYPVGRRRLEPVGILVFSVIMITSFVQVALEGFSKLTGKDHEIVRLSAPAIAIMAATVVIKGGCWLWCRLIKNSSVQALAQDAMTDVVFNIFSIIFPLVGYYAQVWWLDPLGGILLSLWVIFNWAQTSSTHIRNLTGCAAPADERNVLLYLTMRFAKTIKQIQGLQAYHSGDKLNVEVDLVLDESTTLRDSHDLGESLQYVLESVPNVDRAFVHLDYAGYNLPSHLQQDS
nr:metal tolerance protein 3 [Quercus suber]